MGVSARRDGWMRDALMAPARAARSTAVGANAWQDARSTIIRTMVFIFGKNPLKARSSHAICDVLETFDNYRQLPPI